MKIEYLNALNKLLIFPDYLTKGWVNYEKKTDPSTEDPIKNIEHYHDALGARTCVRMVLMILAIAGIIALKNSPTAGWISGIVGLMGFLVTMVLAHVMTSTKDMACVRFAKDLDDLVKHLPNKYHDLIMLKEEAMRTFTQNYLQTHPEYTQDFARFELLEERS